MSRLYALIAIIVAVTAVWLLKRWNDNQFYPNKPLYRYIVAIFVGGFWLLFVPAIMAGIIIHTCAYHLAEIEFKAVAKDLWGQIKDLWGKVKNFFKLIFKHKQ